MEIGLEKFENLWCIFKKDKGVELWLNKNKKWSKKDDRAGIKDYKKAENLLLNLLKDKACITNQKRRGRYHVSILISRLLSFLNKNAKIN